MSVWKLPRCTTAEREAITPAQSEVLYDTDENKLYTGDGSTAGGVEVSGSGSGGGGVTVQDEGSGLTTIGDTLNFTGAGVTASGTTATKTISIPGGATAGAPNYQTAWTVVERTNIAPTYWTGADVWTINHGLGTHCPQTLVLAQCDANQIANDVPSGNANSVEVSGGGTISNQLVLGQIYELQPNGNPYWDLNLSGGPDSDPNYCGIFMTHTDDDNSLFVCGNQGIFKIDNLFEIKTSYPIFSIVCLTEKVLPIP